MKQQNNDKTVFGVFRWVFLTQRERKYEIYGEMTKNGKLLDPMGVRGVETLMNSASTGLRRFGRAWPDGPDVGGQHRFTNTAAPRFDGTGCWQQHLLVFRAMKSNGWSMATAALQLFAHLDGEALQVALLMPDKARERWKDLVDKLSAYYNTPGLFAGNLKMRAGVRG